MVEDNRQRGAPHLCDWAAHLVFLWAACGAAAGPTEISLAPTGGNGGVPFQLQCPAGKLSNGLLLRTDAFVDSVALSCESLERADPWTSASIGGTNGTRVTLLRCLAGEVLVGATGRSGTLNDAIGPICASVRAVRSRSTFAFRDPPVGGEGGLPWERRCPPAMAVSGIHGRAGANIDRIEFECRPLPAP
jgi:hypothetical protein